MNRISRAVAIATLVIAGSAGFTACGTDEAPLPSAEQARAAACRGYVLDVGDVDVAKAKELMAAAGPGVDADSTNDALAPVRVAAVTAGRTAGLSDADFALFRAVVESVDAIRAGILFLDDGSTSLGAAPIAQFQKDVGAVHKRCY